MDQIVPQAAHQRRAVRISRSEITQKQWPPAELFCGPRELTRSHVSGVPVIHYTPVPLLHSSAFMTAVCSTGRIHCLIAQVLFRPAAGRPSPGFKTAFVTFRPVFFFPFRCSSNIHFVHSVRPSSG